MSRYKLLNLLFTALFSKGWQSKALLKSVEVNGSGIVSNAKPVAVEEVIKAWVVEN